MTQAWILCLADGGPGRSSPGRDAQSREELGAGGQGRGTGVKGVSSA